jgi:hypothetical protein
MVMADGQQQTAAAEAEWVALLDKVGESAPGTYLQEGEVLSRGEDGAAPTRVASLRFKGYEKVWNTKTGDLSLQPWWLLWQTMRKRHEDGTLAFTRTDPKIKPDYGADLTCPLNPAAPPDQNFSGKGFKPCKKQHIPHWDALQRHIKKSHGRAWDAMERERLDRERAEDRALQREAIETQRQYMELMMRQSAGNAGMTVPSVTVAAPAASLQDAIESLPATGGTILITPDEPVKVRKPRVQREGHRTCEVCGAEFTGKNNGGATLLLSRHTRSAHPSATG